MISSYLLLTLLFLTIWTNDGHVIIKDGDITVMEVFTEDRTVYFPKANRPLDIESFPYPCIEGERGVNYQVPGRSFVIEIPEP